MSGSEWEKSEGGDLGGDGDMPPDEALGEGSGEPSGGLEAGDEGGTGWAGDDEGAG